MGIIDILKWLFYLTLPAIKIFLILLAVLVLYYFLYYRRKRPASVLRARKKQLICSALLIAYLLVVGNITLLNRSSSDSMSMNLHLFSSYIETWNSYSPIFPSDLRIIIYNIIMFIPLGILLPLVNSKFKAFKWLFPVVFGATLLIETSQLVTGRGGFALDDLFNNTLGGVIGYQFYRLVASVVYNKKVRLRDFLGNLAIPLLIILLFVGMNIVYSRQEFGNLSINPSVRLNMSGVKLTSSLELNSAPSVAPVYRDVTNPGDHGLEVATRLQQKLGFSELTPTGHNGDHWSYTYKDKLRNPYTLYYFEGGDWSLHQDNQTPAETNSSENNEQMVEKAKSLLVDLDMLPEGAQLTILDTAVFQWTIPKIVYSNKDFWDGNLMLTLNGDGSINTLINRFTRYQFMREVDIISPAEAYERIKQGKFRAYNKMPYKPPFFPNRDPLVKDDKLNLTKMDLGIVADTKGYFQPVYQFSGTLNKNSDWYAVIAAKQY